MSIISGTIRTALAAVTLLACAATVVRADDKSDVKAAGKAFVEAIRADDMPSAKKHAVTDAKGEKFLDTLGALNAAKKKLTEAAVAKFGDEGKNIVNPGLGLTNAIQMNQNFDDAEVEIKGDAAVLTYKEGNSRPAKFKREGGDWKVDFSDPAHDDQLERGMPIMDKMAIAMNETAGDISDEKYKTVEEAKMGFHLKLAAAMGLSGNRAGSPRKPDNK